MPLKPDCEPDAEDVVRALRRMSVETGSLVCLGCGHEHNCSIHGCAIIRQAADLIERLNDFQHSQCAKLLAENGQLRAVITENDPNFFKRKCRLCGCDWNHPCNDHDFWVEDDLCSACASKQTEAAQ